MIYESIGTISGKKIFGARTINSMYADNCIILIDTTGEEYRMNVDEIKKFDTKFDKITFDIIEKSKHKYLRVRE